MPWWLRNEHTRASIHPLPLPVGLPTRLRSRAICRSGIWRANSRISDKVSSGIVQRCLPTVFFFELQRSVVAALPMHDDLDMIAFDAHDDLVQCCTQDPLACRS